MKKNLLSCMLIALLFCGAISASETDLPRRAQWAASFKTGEPVGRTITAIDPQSALTKAGLKVGDTILAVDNRLIDSSANWNDTTDHLRSDNPHTLTVKRGLKVFDKQVQFHPAPKESYPGIVTDYNSVISDFGIKQRTIITYPEDRGSLPAIFVVGGLSCSSIEYLPGRKSNFIRSLQYLVQHSDMLVMRIEKPGMGDSEGACSKTDFKTELNGYEVALQTLLADERVNPSKIVIYGSSMGSAIAPYLANKYSVAGIISDGTFYRSWFEHMLEIERRIKAMQGKTQSEINNLINTAYIPLYYGMLIEKKSYQEVIEEKPLLAKHNYHGKAHMYGRPVEYYHQVQDFNFAGEWSKLTTPARIRYGLNDWIMSEYDIDILEGILKEKAHDDFKVLKVPGLDHWDTIHESALNSFQGKPGKWTDDTPQQLVEWAQELVSN